MLSFLRIKKRQNGKSIYKSVVDIYLLNNETVIFLEEFKRKWNQSYLKNSIFRHLEFYLSDEEDSTSQQTTQWKNMQKEKSSLEATKWLFRIYIKRDATLSEILYGQKQNAERRNDFLQDWKCWMIEKIKENEENLTIFTQVKWFLWKIQFCDWETKILKEKLEREKQKRTDFEKKLTALLKKDAKLFKEAEQALTREASKMLNVNAVIFDV